MPDYSSLKMTMDLHTHVTSEKSSMEIEKIVPENNIVDIGRKMAWLLLYHFKSFTTPFWHENL